MPNTNSLRYHGASIMDGLTRSNDIEQIRIPLMTFSAWRLRPRNHQLRSLALQHHSQPRSQPPTLPPHRLRVRMAAVGPPAGSSGGDSYDYDLSGGVDGDGGYGSGYVFDPDEGKAVSGRSPALAALADNLKQVTDTNTLQTARAAARGCQDFPLAAAVRDRLRELATEGGGAVAAERIDWRATRLTGWLTERAERLGYRFPTEVQRRATPVLLSGADAVISSATGSGKSLAFLLPLLGRMTYPPDIFMEEMKGPQGLVLVPSMELGVQHALSAFRLFGGTISSGRPGDAANMFTYTGPKGIKVRGVLNKEEVVMAKSSLTYLRQVHLVVGTPAAVMEAVREPQPAAGLLQHLKVLVVDEVDECFTAFPRDMEELMQLVVAPGGTRGAAGAAATGAGREKTQVVFVGATQRQDVLQSAVEQGWLRDPVRIQVGREDTIPPALSHRYIVVPAARRLAALARCLRADLAAADEDGAPARVMLFVDTPAQAAAVAEPLRSSLWADHRMAVLVPPGTILHRDADSDAPPKASTSTPDASSSSSSSWPPPQASLPSSTTGPGGASSSTKIRESGGRGAQDPPADDSASSSSILDDMFAYNPIRALHSFRDNTSSLLLATGAAARGLDLPAVTHVYSLGPPPDATQYLHRAGRAGRIGSTSGGIVTTLLNPEELPALLAMAQQLGIQLVQEQEPEGKSLGALPRLQAPSEEGGEGQEGEGAQRQGQTQEEQGVREGGGNELGDVEQLRKGLEDLFHLM